MEEAKERFWLKPVKVRTFLILICLSMAALTAILVLYSCWDTDTLWLVATGREILENGIPYENPFSVHEGLLIVVQQWLFCVILALFDKLGYAGYWLFGALNVALLGITTWSYLKRRQKNKILQYASVLLMLLVFSVSLCTPRPEAVTIDLLLLECMAYEQYGKTGNQKWLVLLPLTMLLEANLHGSMIWFHLAVAAAYLVPSVKKSWYQTSLKCDKKIALWSLSMAPVAFLNPYGLDGVLYLINSYRAGTFDYVDIIETAAPELFSYATVYLILAGLLVWFAYKFGELKSHQLYLALGFGALSFMALRNVEFLYLAVLALLPPLLERLESMEVKLEPKRYVIPVFAFVLCYMGIGGSSMLLSDIDYTGSELYEIVDSQVALDDMFSDMYEYMRDNSGKDVSEIKLFAGFDNGAYFEYVGFRKVFMDARPELLMSSVNKTVDLLPAYSYLMIGYSSNYPYEDTVADGIARCLAYYDFDYLVVEKGIEVQLLTYLDTAGEASGYVKVMESDRDALYEKVVE